MPQLSYGRLRCALSVIRSSQIGGLPDETDAIGPDIASAKGVPCLISIAAPL